MASLRSRTTIGALVILLVAGGLGAYIAEQPAIGSVAPDSAFGGGNYTLETGSGKPFTDASLAGAPTMLFFGYTHCPDVCPTTMADLAAALKLMGDRASEVQVLFVTVDPERDTQEILSQFVPSFNPTFVGLYGSPEQTAETAKNFKIFYEKQVDPGKSGYTIDHSAGVYAFDKQGKIRIYLKFGQKPEELAHDLGTLL